MTLAATVAHPAPFSPGVLATLCRYVEPDWLVLDPFAGIGRIHTLDGARTVGVELEPEWAGAHRCTIVGNALALPFADATFDAIATSPTYGNRMADHHDARDTSKRHTYRHALGRALHPDNSGALQWGKDYRRFHRAAWSEAVRVLRPGGRFLLNSKDHIRDGQRQKVTGWHVLTLTVLGLAALERRQVTTPGMGHGANGRLRVEYEEVVVFERRA